jgi:inorganic pyrophosphatase
MSAEPLLCIVEIPKGSRNKYEYDAELGAIKLDRFISASVVYPTDYGYLPETLAPDGDPLDMLVCVSEPTFPGCIVPSKAIGVFLMEDEKGRDDHVVCVPCSDPGWSGLNDIDDLPAHAPRSATSSRCTRISIKAGTARSEAGPTVTPRSRRSSARASASGRRTGVASARRWRAILCPGPAG